MTATKKVKPQDDEIKKAAKLFKPLFRFVLAKKIPLEDKKSAGGIIVELSTQNKNQLAHTNKAIIVACGSKAFEYELLENRPKMGDVVHCTRYEDFAVDHSTEFLEGEYCMIYDEYITAIETKGE